MGNISALANNVVQTTPVGVIQPFAGINVPAGWLFCDGSAVSRVQYPELFSALSTTYGSGDGSTTFNLPDMRGRVPAGRDNMGGAVANRLTSGNSGITATSLGANGGDERMHQHTHIQNAHSHSVEAPGGHTWGANFGGLSGGATFTFSPAGVYAGVYAGQNLTAMGVTATNQNTGSGNSQNVQPTLIVNYIIKAVADLPRGGWFYQNSPPVVTQLPSNPQIGEQVYLYSAYGYTYQRYNGSAWDVISDNRKVYFQAHTSSILGTTAGTTMAFNRTVSNQGSCFNTSTYLFTAPFAGDYKFRVQAQKRNAGVMQMFWLINGSTTNNRGVYTDIGNDSVAPNMEVILNLAANTTVGVYYTLSAGDVYGAAAEYFTAFTGEYIT
jgi:microcystin-dependent protein